MKTKITTLLMVSFFFLSAVTFADGEPTNQKTDSSTVYLGPPDIVDHLRSVLYDIDNIIDYILPPFWESPPEAREILQK